VSGDGYDFFVVGLQEAPHFDVKSSISEALGDKYWWESCSLRLCVFEVLACGMRNDILWD